MSRCCVLVLMLLIVSARVYPAPGRDTIEVSGKTIIFFEQYKRSARFDKNGVGLSNAAVIQKGTPFFQKNGMNVLLVKPGTILRVKGELKTFRVPRPAGKISFLLFSTATGFSSFRAVKNELAVYQLIRKFFKAEW